VAVDQAVHDGTVPQLSQGRTGRPPVTSRAEILAAARHLIDQDGWEKLTIRRLATQLGIGATTLYHHVRDREDLVVLLLNEFIAQIPRPELPEDPRDRIIAAAVAAHDALAAWPWAAEVLTTDGFIGRLDESALWLVEEILASVIAHGHTQPQAIYIFRTIWYYMVGEILVRAHSRRHPAALETTPANFPPAHLPHLAAAFPHWATIAAQNTYPNGLRALVDGLLTQTTFPP
jgi:AcrR family transcriptional regulator